MPLLSRERTAAVQAWVRAPSVRLDEAYSSGRGNSIGFLRWIFASAVIYYHGYILSVFAQNPIARDFYGFNVGRAAVVGFFLLSGFLVAKSYRSSTGVFNFVWKRSLRIFPAFWGCLIVTLAVLAPLSWYHAHHTIHGYRAIQPWKYFTENWTLRLHRTDLPGTFGGTRGAVKAHAAIPNGSIWTIWYEFRCYLVVAVLGLATLLWQRRAVILAATGVLGIVLVGAESTGRLSASAKLEPSVLGQILQPLQDLNLALFLFTFFIGVCFALYADVIVLDDRVGLGCLIALFLIARWHGDFNTLSPLPMAYTILWLGRRLPMHWWDRMGDTSYGVYLYGWPIELLLAEYGVQTRWGMHVYLLLSVLVTTAVGWLSWHLLEKHAMKLKSFDPYRLIKRRIIARYRRPGPPAEPTVDAPSDPAPVSSGG